MRVGLFLFVLRSEVRCAHSLPGRRAATAVRAVARSALGFEESRRIERIAESECSSAAVKVRVPDWGEGDRVRRPLRIVSIIPIDAVAEPFINIDEKEAVGFT